MFGQSILKDFWIPVGIWSAEVTLISFVQIKCSAECGLVVSIGGPRHMEHTDLLHMFL